MRQNYSWDAAPPPAEPATSLGRPLAICRAYDELIDALRARAEELRVSRESLDEIMKTLPDGYASKLLAPVLVKFLGRISLGPMIQALGLAIVLVEDEAAIARISGHIGTRDETQARKGAVRSVTVHIKIPGRRFKQMQRRGGQNSRKYLPASVAWELGRRASLARWAKPRRGAAAQ